MHESEQYMLISAGRDERGELVDLCRQGDERERNIWPPPLVTASLPKAEAERLRDKHNAIFAFHERKRRDTGETERIEDVIARLDEAGQAAGDSVLNDLLCDAFATIRFLRNPQSLHYLRLVADEREG